MLMRRKSSVTGETGNVTYTSLTRIGRNENTSVPAMARATPHRRYDAVLNDRISTFLAAAEDRAEDAAQYLPAELGADRARRALRQCFDHALRLAAAARTRLAEKDVRHRVRATRRLGRLCRRSAFELFVRRFAVNRRVVLARNR